MRAVRKSMTQKVRMTDSPSIRDILDFWFLPLDHPEHGKLREDVWWKAPPEFDAEVDRRFSAALDQAIMGAFDHWRRSPDGALALIILCDQFPRHIHRRTARAFCGDPKARETARYALARGYPAAFDASMRGFFFLPFGHSEVLADQELACALYTAFREDLKHAIEHRDIVARFGRFPHRNEVLNRATTAEELEYLKTANRFGQ
jgi:uncharacterized protein (DUF924 family)